MLINSLGIHLITLKSLSFATLSRNRVIGAMHSQEGRQTQAVATSLAGLHFLRTWKAAVWRVSEGGLGKIYFVLSKFLQPSGTAAGRTGECVCWMGQITCSSRIKT